LLPFADEVPGGVHEGGDDDEDGGGWGHVSHI
jgi:hypothetical protein